MWPYLLGVYQLDNTDDECRTQDEDSQKHYEKLIVEWQAAEKLAQKREQENATSENPALRHSFSERHNHEIKMAIFRKDSSLSNDVFESLDAPCSGTLDETCRPETVVEESSCVTSPTTEPPVSSMEVECREVIESLPVKAGMINLYLQSLILFFICLGLTLRTT